MLSQIVSERVECIAATIGEEMHDGIIWTAYEHSSVFEVVNYGIVIGSDQGSDSARKEKVDRSTGHHQYIDPLLMVNGRILGDQSWCAV